MRTSNSPSYLIKNPYSYCFRIKIPKDLRSTIARKELRYSLKTGNLSDAKSKARFMAGQVQQLFKGFQKGGLKSMDINKDQINKMLKKYLQDLIADYDKPAIPNWQQKDEDMHSWASDEAAVQGSIEVLEDIVIPEYNAKLHSGDYSDVEPIAHQLREEHGITDEIDTTSSLYRYLCDGILRVKIKEFRHQQKRLSGDFLDDLERILDDQSEIQSPQKTQTEQESITLGELADAYEKDNQIGLHRPEINGLQSGRSSSGFMTRRPRHIQSPGKTFMNTGSF